MSRDALAELTARFLRRSIECYHAGDTGGANVYRTLFRVTILRLFECPD